MVIKQHKTLRKKEFSKKGRYFNSEHTLTTKRQKKHAMILRITYKKTFNKEYKNNEKNEDNVHF